MTGSSKRRALGRGLSALIPSSEPTRPAASGDRTDRAYIRAPIEDVYPNPDQPRRQFDDSALDELAASIRAHGVIQPLIVRERAEGGYFLIAGERRWRASQRAGLREVPAVVQDVSPLEAFERALVENLQRSDLNAIEEAEAYARLIDAFGHTQEQVAERVGKDRSTVANSLRLLKLPAAVRAMVEAGELSMGHARALLRIGDPDAIEAAARRVAARRLSVRATEKLAAARSAAPAAPRKPRAAGKSASVRDLENRLTKSLGAAVAVDEDASGKGGALMIRYLDLDDLDRLLELLLR